MDVPPYHLHLVNCFHHPSLSRKLEKSQKVRDGPGSCILGNGKKSVMQAEKMAVEIKIRVGWLLGEDLGGKLRAEIRDNLGKILLSSLIVTETNKDFQ